MISFSVLADPVVVGSKKFTESVILGEVLKMGLESEGLKAIHRQEIGGTTLLWNALLSGDIDLYPEYTGTIQEEILKTKSDSFEELLAQKGVGISKTLGFNDTYAVGMMENRARELGIESISDLRKHPDLIMGWASEFMERKDGWPGLRNAYKLPQVNLKGMDHEIGYRALVEGEIDVIDLYSTDAEIPYYGIRVLKDDLQFFPKYDAVVLYRIDKKNEILPFLSRLVGKINEEEMSKMNRLVKIDRKNASEVASTFLKTTFMTQTTYNEVSRTDRLLQRTAEHLRLVGISLILAILLGVPLGIVSAKKPRLGRFILMFVSAVQTIPALALLVLLIRPLSIMGLPGIGETPALIALFLYSLLPIVRNTCVGISEIPVSLKETATVLNLSPSTVLKKIELPLALPYLLAGIKTSLVLNIGFATLGALVGAGGYGQSILTGIRLDNYEFILEGAVPAALLALVTQFLFEVFEKRFLSKGLRP